MSRLTANTSCRKTGNQLRKLKPSTMSLLSSPGKFKLPMRGIVFGVLLSLLVQGTMASAGDDETRKALARQQRGRYKTLEILQTYTEPDKSKKNVKLGGDISRPGYENGGIAKGKRIDVEEIQTAGKDTWGKTPGGWVLLSENGKFNVELYNESKSPAEEKSPAKPAKAGKKSELADKPVNDAADDTDEKDAETPANERSPRGRAPIAPPVSNHDEFELEQLRQDQPRDHFADQAQTVAQNLETSEAKLRALEKDLVSEEIRDQARATNDVCIAMDDELVALKNFVDKKEITKAAYIEQAVTQKRDEHRRKKEAATADVAAAKDKQKLLESLKDQTDAHNDARKEIADHTHDQLKKYIEHNADRAQNAHKDAAKQAAAAAKAVDDKHDALHSELKASHTELSGKHDTFQTEITEKVDGIDGKLDENETDKTVRHEATLGEAKDFTTQVRDELNNKAESLEKRHGVLRADHADLDNVVGTHSKNLETTKSFILNRYGRDAWDNKCDTDFGKWADAPEPLPRNGERRGGRSPRPGSDMSENSTDLSERESPRSPAAADGSPKREPARNSVDRRRLASNCASMTPSQQALKRRLIAQPKSHNVVLEALMEEINRLN